MPCLMSTRCRYSLLTGAFSEGWDGPIRDYVEQGFAAGSECQACSDRHWCGYCPEYITLEGGGSESGRPEWMCRLAKARKEKAESLRNGE